MVNHKRKNVKLKKEFRDSLAYPKKFQLNQIFQPIVKSDYSCVPIGPIY